MSAEPNGTVTALMNIKNTPLNECIGLKQLLWLNSHLPPYVWLIFILGFIENLFVISVFVLHKSRCTVTEIYLGNMAAADLIFVTGLPFWAIYISNKFYWPFGGFMCKVVNSMFRLNLYSSIYFLMMVSIDRYLALVKPMTINRLRRPGWAKVNCGIIWMSTAVLNLPNSLFRKVMFIKEFNTTACVVQMSSNWFIATNMIMNVLGFLVPLAVTSFCTYHMIPVLRNNAMQKFKKMNKEKKATWLVLTVFLAFIVCWLPYNISTFIDILDHFHVFRSCTVTSMNQIFTQISTYLAFSNSCINPVIYSMVGICFRQKAREVYSRLLCKRQDHRSQQINPATQLSLSPWHHARSSQFLESPTGSTELPAPISAIGLHQ